MRTYYPNPQFSDEYKYVIVNSSFIHAIHLAKSKNSWIYQLGVSFLKDEDTIHWYSVKDPCGLYRNLVDTTKSPGFIFNNSLRNKPYSVTTVNVKKPAKVTYTNSRYAPPGAPTPKQLEEARKIKAEFESHQAARKAAAVLAEAQRLADLKAAEEKANKDAESLKDSMNNQVLHHSGKNSSVIGILSLGYDSKTKGFVVYYNFKARPHDVYAFRTDDAAVYRNWSEADSLGRHYNEHIKGNFKPYLLRAVAEETVKK